jgi:hypothetical protein
MCHVSAGVAVGEGSLGYLHPSDIINVLLQTLGL